MINKLTIILMTVGLGCLSACDNDEFLTNERFSFAYGTPAEYEFAAQGAYAKVNSHPSPGNTVFTNFMMSKLMASDEILRLEGIAESGTVPQAYFRDFENENTYVGSTNFGRAYDGILNANFGIQFYEEANGEPFGELIAEEQAGVDRVAGELYFLRAYFYYWLARVYLPWYDPTGNNTTGQLPFYDRPLENITEGRASDLVNTQEVWDFVVADLERAKTLLPPHYDPAVHPELYADGRADGGAARALLARVYFNRGEWDQALTNLNEVIDDPHYAIEDDPLEAWNKRGPVPRSPEVIWYLSNYFEGFYAVAQISTITKLHGNFKQPGFGGKRGFAPSSEFGSHYLSPFISYSLSDHISEYVGWMEDPVGGNYTATPLAEQDKRYNQVMHRYEASITQAVASGAVPADFVDSLGVYLPSTGDNIVGSNILDKTSVIDRPYIYLHKYYRYAGSDARGRVANIPVLRLPEVILTRAIILARGGNGAGEDEGQALADLNLVRTTRGLESVTASGETLEEEIHQERAREMMGENDRLEYLMTLGLPIEPGDRTNASVVNAPYSDFHYQIPAEELNNNGSY
ncbi:MAG: RagB/SusD family nutrient uptake outer membrane protein [Bacteroidota bacterium]